MRRALVPALTALLLAGGLPLASSDAASPTASPTERWALVIGITDYAGSTHSTVAGARDAGLVKNVLLDQGWKSDHIRVLTEKAASGSAIRAGLSWLASKQTPTTFTALHFSGHVKQTSAGEFLWSQDNVFLKDTDVAAVLKRGKGTGWVDIAGCEANGFNHGLSDSNHLFTASSKTNEKSYEDPKAGMSVWARQLFSLGIRDQAADADHDGKVSVQEAYTWATPRATTITSKQTPHGPQHPQHAGWSGSLNLANPRTLR